MHKKSWHKILDIDISMHENENFALNIFADENPMHEIVHSPISHENFWGAEVIPGNFGGKIFIFIALKFQISWHDIFKHESFRTGK